MKHIYIPLLISIILQWMPFGESCGIPDNMYCTSAGLLSDQRNGAVLFSADIFVMPAQDNRFWAAIVLNENPIADNHYVSSVIENNIMPYVSSIADTNGPASTILANGADHCCSIFENIQTNVSHHVSLSYDGDKTVIACVDGLCDVVTTHFDNYQLELLCAGVNPGESGDNKVRCSFTNIHVE
jgi:hypothetical protein